ncbi:uncharacterized protein LOC107633038 [Arachis ipaensis]|uniref:uncharacterized protein LOC107633038 n=1 Tax=Arachis ipaensis TaxID=130454 RepID=UPI0007AFDDE3|nr:uncharacterized protein LOC107633038 [Arachis ipaensis]XP_025638905.1 uncharacterized protein LOC112733973 [Arachis hypogaea]
MVLSKLLVNGLTILALNLSFTCSPHENALFICKSERGVVLLLLYIDDMIIAGDDVDGISNLKASLHRIFEMKNLGSLSYFLGLEVISTDDGISLSQAKYAFDLLARADNLTLYRQLVGGLVYLTVTRPDITYLVHVLSQFLSAPRTTHYVAAYSDADWAGDPTDRGSTISYCLFLGDSLIFWRAKKKTFIAISIKHGS